ncbi:MAG: hypothetical protein B1H03_02740 [Planctomycetales bacterium 4484_113]|nr:MAG: hypothetical protein B1H03_02740 [Planctomycetales bacterium 4484_113]
MAGSASDGSGERFAGVVLLAAGEGERYRGAVPKLMTPLEGQPLITLAARTVVRLPFVRELVLVANPKLREDIAAAMSRLEPEIESAGMKVSLCDGGETRSDSVAQGLDAISSECVLIHDGSRPLATAALFKRVLDAVEPGVGAVPVIEARDSLLALDDRNEISGYLERPAIRLVQTPQGFITSEYRAARRQVGREASAFTDDGSLFLAAGYRLVMVPGEEENLKITYLGDLRFLPGLLAEGGKHRR